jgi:hypothetical protein
LGGVGEEPVPTEWKDHVGAACDLGSGPR